MHNELKQFGVKATNSFKRRFNQSLLKLSFLYGTILVAILFVSGFITFTEFSSRIGRRFQNIQPTITIQLPTGEIITNRPPNTPPQNIIEQRRNNPENSSVPMPTAKDIRDDLIASLIFVNGILLLIASVSSYWLARSTLRPIRDSYERQRRFLGDASHELRTPLSILQLELENELHGSTGAKRDALVSKLEEVRRMGKLVSDLLTISRLDEGSVSPKEKQLTVRIHQLAHLLESITERLKPLALSHNVALTFHNIQNDAKTYAKNHESLLVSLEEDLFSHALTNLIQNAIIYNKQGGKVDVALYIEHKKVIVEIKDNGIGISKQDLENIFERFYRADKSRTRQQAVGGIGGSGLGLSIAKSALLHMGGDLIIQSELHIGTTAHIELKTLHN